MNDDLSLDVTAEYRTLQNIVTDQLRSAILSGRLGPGERLQHDEIARQLGVSRMPVREALRVLDGEGLVELRPHRGAVVVDLRPEDIAEVFEIRAMLEGRAAELAGPRLSEATLTRMRQILVEMERLGKRDGLSPGDLALAEGRWLTLNTEFHTIIYPASGWPRLCTLIEAQRNVVQPHLRIAAAYLGRTESAHHEHAEILRAAEARDGKRLAELTVAHLRATATELIDYLASRRPSDDAGDQSNGARATS
jgi:DNA-binding GntR family transcriptional regulator